MKFKLKIYINRRVFSHPQTVGIAEQKKHLFSMMRVKYDDCQSKGMSDVASYMLALATI